MAEPKVVVASREDLWWLLAPASMLMVALPILAAIYLEVRLARRTA